MQRKRAQANAQAKRLAARARAAAGREADSRSVGALSAGPKSASGRFSVERESPLKNGALLVIVVVLALIPLVLSLIPAYVVPWYRASMVLEAHRHEFALVGGMALLATGIFFLMVVLGG